ncbi:MAG: FAD-dependent oxidoreductase [Campylobacterales bacterium]|nr:FAD-dependent oxidoreductase [Campylobacterales bacterium]
MNNHYETLIVGGGISSTALAYELARYTDIQSICILEKYSDVGSLNTAASANSQTIHFGDIETYKPLEATIYTKN